MATRPGRGTVIAGRAAFNRRMSRAAQRSGRWRTDTPYNGQDGLKVTLRAVKGLTPKDRLQVPMRFACPPTGEFSRDWSYEWAKFQTLRIGERSRAQGRPLKSWQIATMLFDDIAAGDADFLVRDADHDPQKTIRELALLLGDDPSSDGAEPVPFRLTIGQSPLWGTPWLVNSVVVLVQMRATQRPGEIGVEYLDLSFDEYDPLEVDRRKARRSSKAERRRLRPGDTLYEIARKELHSPSSWRLIAKANGIKGVRPGSAGDLAAWAKKHHKQDLAIPETQLRGTVTGKPKRGAPEGF